MRSSDTVGQVVAAGAIPIVLGGDHSIAEPDIRACAASHGPVGLVHFDTHTDTGTEVFGVERSHGTPMYRLVEDGIVDPRRYVQIGLRGYWPGEREFAWQRERGITSFFMHDVRELGIDAVVERDDRDASATAPCSCRSTSTCSTRRSRRHRHPRARRDDERGSPPGVPRARRERLDVVGAEVVEVIPTAVGSADVTALVAERIVREILTGLALRKDRRARDEHLRA